MKPARRPLRLRTQLALMMIAGVAAAFVIGYGGILIFDQYEYAAVEQRLSPGAKRAVAAIDAGLIPDMADFRELQQFSIAAGPEYENRQRLALLLLVLFAAICGAAASLFLARRFAQPLQDLAIAARAVASGDLTARATKAAAAFEIAQLIADFNQMAQALERGERKLREDAAAIAHELRTPLMVLQARLEALADGLLPANEAEHRRLVLQTQLLGRIVEDLRTLSLARAGRLSVLMHPQDLAMVAREAAGGFHAIAAQANVNLIVQARAAPVLGDLDRLMQSSAALIDNAIRYGGCGGEVLVETYIDGETACLAVRDRGPGLPADLPSMSLFDAFVRGEQSRARQSGGSGLGLAVVQAVAKAHGGTASAQRRQGGGAEFVIALPRRDFIIS